MFIIFSSEVAKHIKPDSYALIFGFNLFMSLLIISIFTLLFIQGLVVVIGTKNQVRYFIQPREYYGYIVSN